MWTLLALLIAPDAGACDRPDDHPSGVWEEMPARFAGGAGAASLSPDELPVYDKVSLTYTYTVGAGGMAVGDRLRLEDPQFHGMRWAKWGFLSTDASHCSEFDPSEKGSSGGLITVSHTGGGDVTFSTFRNTNTPDIHAYAFTEISLLTGSLEPGDRVYFNIGDLAGGSLCGLQTSNRTMERVSWILLEQLDGATDWTEVSPPPTFSFVTELPAVTLLVSAPTQALPGEPVTVRVAALDRLGNPTPSYSGDVSLSLGGETLGSHRFAPSDGGVWAVEVTLEDEAIARLTATDGDLSGTSNPVMVEADPPAMGIYWGDIHTHHGHSYEDGGAVVDQNHDYGRDVVGLQFGCESLKASPHELDWENLWPEFQQTCEDYTVDDEYVALLCFEWMGNENSPGEEGHHNVYYDSCDGPLAPNTTTGLTGSDISLWAFMEEAEASTGARSISVPHATSYTGYNWRDRDDALRPLAEVYSEWGSSAELHTLGAGVYDGLAAGHRMGLTAASDNHDGWLGNRWAAFYSEGGLGALVATDLSREGLFDAMQSRSAYGTTGIRPALRFSAEDGADVAMGVEYVADTPTFRWLYAGEGEVSEVALLSVTVDGAGDPTLDTLASWTPDTLDAEGEYTYAWDGQPRAVWLHAVEADGEEAWSSPIWLSADCDDERVEDPAGRCDTNKDKGGPDDTAPPGDDGGDDTDVTGDDGDGGDDTEAATDTGGGEGKDRSCGCAGAAGSGGALPLALLGLLALGRRTRRRRAV